MPATKCGQVTPVAGVSCGVSLVLIAISDLQHVSSAVLL